MSRTNVYRNKTLCLSHTHQYNMTSNYILVRYVKLNKLKIKYSCLQ